MMNALRNLLRDENGFVISAELILVATIAVLGLIVGLSEIATNVNNELEDVGSAFGSMNQSFKVQGQQSCHKGQKAGSGFEDEKDACDSQHDIHGTGADSEG